MTPPGFSSQESRVKRRVIVALVFLATVVYWSVTALVLFWGFLELSVIGVVGGILMALAGVAYTLDRWMDY